ncbi:winged helix-turn-helix domain-containing protein [Thalassotalea euphylliae]|uniref:winged helix-turn-helix domain-containing protein n=1 Tax=Thalassotalea euphylliae TaxID=1655234 RepID=UPI003644D3F8
MPRFHCLHYEIDSQALSVKAPNGEPIDIRPKTCQLLILLLENAGSSVSKQTILSSVWRDSVVDEQVIFQSIKELRKLFADDIVIKTIPKQGYVWLAEVKTVNEQSSDNKVNRLTITFVASIIFIAAITGVYTQYWTPAQHASPSSVELNVSGSVVILPTENRIPGNDHSWIRLGLMDQLIQRLPSNDQVGVLQTDYVMQVLERASAPLTDIKPDHIPNIFTVSGADFIVATRLSGSPHDYQLSYTFYRPNSQHKGAIFNRDIQGAIDELGDLIATRIGPSSPYSASQYHADFNNEMLGVAIDLKLENKDQQAIALLKSIVDSDANNLTAHRLLVESYLKTGSIEDAKYQLNAALPVAREQADNQELTRLLYFQSIYSIMNGTPELAAQTIAEGLGLAQESKDWLFLAYLTELQATIAMHTDDFLNAEKLIEEAKGYHQVLKCPLGETQSWIFLSELAKRQNDTEKQSLALKKAMDIATKRHLTIKIDEIESLINSL